MNPSVTRITRDPQVRGGRPCIRGTHIRVTDILDLLATGSTAQQVVQRMPGLEPADIEAALKFASGRLSTLNPVSVVFDRIAPAFDDVRFEVFESELHYVSDIDYLGHVTGSKAFGIQIKPVSARSNFGNYSASERMKASFADFTQDFGGKVFIVSSLDGEIANEDVIERIKNEIERLGR